VHIATGDGLLSTQALEEAERSVFTPQDLARWDKHPDHISCSVEYPNAWYYRQKAASDPLFRTWVVLTVDPRHIWRGAARFCHRNAAAAGGAFIRDGVDGFVGLYESPLEGSGGMMFTRTATHLSACPTDNQAEVLIERFIPIGDIQAVAVQSEDHAAHVYAGLDQIGGAPEAFTFTVAPELFDPYALARAIRMGRRPPEVVWTP
jgi:hypothetical protein